MPGCRYQEIKQSLTLEQRRYLVVLLRDLLSLEQLMMKMDGGRSAAQLARLLDVLKI
jgi:hypothetical protein